MIVVTTRSIRLDLERRILGGDLPSGTRLASVRSLATDLGVAPGTVAAAYRQLADAGLLTAGKGRQGTRVAPRSMPVPTGAAQPAVEVALPDGIVDAGQGSPGPDLLPAIDQAVTHALQGQAMGYRTAIVHPDLADVARRHFGADALTVTSGAMDAIDRTLRAQNLRPGALVGVEDPGHVPVHQLVRSAGLTPVPLALDRYGVTPASLEPALAQGLACLIVTPRAQNPTGAAFSPERAASLTKLLDEYPEVAIIQDDHAGPVAGTDYQQITPSGQRWVTIRSMGKAYGPDLRLALVFGDQDTINRITIGFSNGPGWVSHILQRSVAYLLEDPATVEAVDAAAERYRHLRSMLIDALAERGVTAVGRSGFNVWIPGVNEQATVDFVRQRGYAIVAGDQWRIQSPSAVRVSISHLADEHIVPLADAIAEAQGVGARRSAVA